MGPQEPTAARDGGSAPATSSSGRPPIVADDPEILLLAAVRPVRSARLLGASLAGTAALVLINAVVQYLHPERAVLPVLERLVDVNGELNIPTAWNASLFLPPAGIAVVIAGLTRGGAARWGWLACAGVVALMGVDEAFRIHERIFTPAGRILLQAGLPATTYTWVLPGALAAGLGALVALRALRRLPRDVRSLLTAALVVYAGGALGAEGVSGAVDRQIGLGWQYVLVTSVEEALEMIGVTLATVAFLRMLRVGEGAAQRALLLRGDAVR